MSISGRNLHLSAAAVVAIAIISSSFLIQWAEAGRQAVPYEYNPQPAVAGDYPLSVQPLKSENCDCGYVLVEKVVHVCRPQKSLVKVLKKKGNCMIHDKPVEVQSKYVEYQNNEPNSVSGSTCPQNAYLGGVELVSHEDDD